MSGEFRSVELATIGRRVCETEWDLLDLLDGAAMIGAYGRPLAAELVAAVAEFLETDVRAATSGQVNFHARVAANALRIVERELLDESEAESRAALAGLASPTRTGSRPPSGPARWTTAPTRSPPACARWCDTDWRLPTPDTTANSSATAS